MGFPGVEAFSKAEIQGIYDEFAPSYVWEERLLNFMLGLRRVRRRLMSQAAGRTLDVAAGIGNNFPYLGQAHTITAVDLSPGMLAQARRRARQLNLAVDCLVMDAEALHFNDDSFDTVVSALATCTFPEPVRALREMGRVCRPGGRILLLEHGRSQWGLLSRWQDYRAERHYRQAGCRWTQEPQQLARAAGLRLVSARRYRAGIFHAIVAQPPA